MAGGKLECKYSDIPKVGLLLTDVIVTGKNGIIAKSCKLSYGGSRNRLLTKISLSDEGSYFFDYDAQDFLSDNAQDWWGYYNGKTSNTSLFPRAKMKLYARDTSVNGYWSDEFAMPTAP